MKVSIFTHDFVLIVKTKDSVGKENAMNLSDHESSDSDGDTDAMCGNVLPITNCMEYLHSYSTPIINEDQLTIQLVINGT
jgi:hypothetical protein